MQKGYKVLELDPPGLKNIFSFCFGEEPFTGSFGSRLVDSAMLGICVSQFLLLSVMFLHCTRHLFQVILPEENKQTSTITGYPIRTHHKSA